jgi:hypothetical protein
MPDSDRDELRFAPETVDHLLAIERKYHRLIRKELHDSLVFAPGLATRNRKMLSQPSPFEATWELRFGPNNRFRAFYEIDFEAKTVWVLAIGVKVGNRLVIGREEFSP